MLYDVEVCVQGSSQQGFKKTYLKEWCVVEQPADASLCSFTVFYTQDEQEAFLKTLLSNPRQYKCCLPGVTCCALSSSPGERIPVCIKFSTELIESEGDSGA